MSPLIHDKMECEDSIPSENALSAPEAHESAEILANETTEMMTTVTPEEIPTETSDSGANEQFSPEYLQRKLYFLLENLKKMHSELPE